MISVIDYGVGNLHSIVGALSAIGEDVKVTGDINDILSAEKIVLPGVGAFGDAADKLKETGLMDAVISRAKRGVPMLGVCLGMQLLFEKSYEYGKHAGLGLLAGDICPMKDDLTEKVKVPHMGWNSLVFEKPSPLTKYISEGDYVYYVHSYYAKNAGSSLSAYSEYGGLIIPGIVSKANVFGCQFHPEKSGEVGLKILKAFSEVKGA
ncbi:MAG: imidazole glycerol phosphate synthase subunit HisH [Clostridia bacterium]|nr:imidazole glycerol phosphate synthase subunit HisH [Clostridia bacterium]